MKTVLYIDKETNFPIYQEMSDEKGVFEKYEYSNLVVNPIFKADDFSDSQF
jgi:outer membrane lipoprotein-sorting protein